MTTAREYLMEILGGDDFVPENEGEAVEMLIESHRRQWEIIHEMPIKAVSWWASTYISLKLIWWRLRRVR